MGTDVAQKVRAAYELRPYPAISRATLRRPPWRLPPWEWIQSVAPGPQPPRRILVAGCGTGLEAFALRRAFPEAEIIAVDFAAHSIRIAHRLQRRLPRLRKIRFLRADLTSDQLQRRIGGEFDFISCHGVMSYLPAPIRALRNLARALTPTGRLYLGVNGQGHFSENWRQFLPAFDFAMARWPGGARLWRHLDFTAALLGEDFVRILQHGPSYLASDLFGPLIHNFALREWIEICRQAGLHLRGCDGAQRRLWPAINDGSYELLLPRRRGEIAELLDTLSPAGFHALIFSRQPEAVPPWKNAAALLRWRPLRTERFRRFKWPAAGSRRLFRFENKAANISLELRGAGWEVALLRGSDGEHSVSQILASLPRVSGAALRSQLYLFYLLDLLNFLPPGQPAKGSVVA
ncbi:MAG: class I SAM-dependent methyltransferase [Chthoniobacterales bacterium]